MVNASSKELYEFEKVLKELSTKKGRATELISIYIPPTKQLSDVSKHMRDEFGQSANIRNAHTRKNVQSAIEVILRRIRLYKEVPEHGLVMFVGIVPKGGSGSEKMVTYVLEPLEPVMTYWYKCSSEFFLEPLEYMIVERDTYGVAVIDRREATIASLKGKKITILTHITSGVPGKNKAGGQSQRRFDRVIEQEAHEFLKRIGNHMNDDFLPLKDDLKGIIVGGPGFTKKDFVDGNYLHYELKQKIVTVEDISDTGEFGIREVISKSSSVLSDLEIIREKKLVERFFEELGNDSGLASYGEEEIRYNLTIGAVDTLLLSEDLSALHKRFVCSNCGFDEEFTIKNQISEDVRCLNCNGPLKEVESSDLADCFVKKAEEMGSNVEFISTETEEGMQLFRAFGGIAAILRYPVGC